MPKRLWMWRVALMLACTIALIVMLELQTHHQRLREHLVSPTLWDVETPIIP